MSNYLYDFGIVKKKDGKTTKRFERLFPNIFEIPYSKPSEYIRFCWQCHEKDGNTNANINGKIFEFVIATLLIREQILPFYLQAKVAFVPNVNYDFLLYTEQVGPIIISAKTSLRERYKQTDLEGMILKSVHRRAKNYLVTLDQEEAARVQKKVESGEVMGIDQVLVASQDSFDQFITRLKEQYTFIESPTIRVIESDGVVTREKIGEKR